MSLSPADCRRGDQLSNYSTDWCCFQWAFGLLRSRLQRYRFIDDPQPHEDVVHHADHPPCRLGSVACWLLGGWRTEESEALTGDIAVTS
jgi:hypothetical protein